MGTSGANLTGLVQAAVEMASGRSLVPALGPGATTVVSVELKPAMPSTAYQAAAFITTSGAGGLNLLGNLEVQNVAVVDSNHVTVTVKNTGLLSLSGAYAVAIAVKA